MQVEKMIAWHLRIQDKGLYFIHSRCSSVCCTICSFFNEDERICVEPDRSIIYDREKLTEEGCNGAPDWILEIVSKSSLQMDYMRKLFQYRSAGV